MIVAVADTHTLIWYILADSRLSENAKNVIDEAGKNGNTIAFSSITFVEMTCLIEKGRISPQFFTHLANRLTDEKGVYQEIPLSLAIVRTFTRISHTQIPEMGDRIIAATALHLAVPLITLDHRIQQANIATIW